MMHMMGTHSAAAFALGEGLSLRRSVAIVVGFSLLCAAPLLARADTILERWCSAWEATPAAELVWLRTMPMRAGDGGPAVGTVGIEERWLARWPDCVIADEHVVHDSEGNTDGMIGRQYHAMNRVHGINARGELIEKRESGAEHLPHQFQQLSFRTSLRDNALRHAANVPFVLAHWMREVGIARGDARVIDLHNGRLRCDVPSEGIAFELENHEHGPVLVAVEKVAEDGSPIWTCAFADVRRVEGCPAPIAFSRTMSVPDGSTRQLVERAPDVLLSFTVKGVVPNSAFEIDLSNSVSTDPSTGEVHDGAGDLVATLPPSRRLSRPAQWSTLIGSVGAGFLVLAAGWWWIKHRRGV